MFKGVWHLGHDEAMEAGGRASEPHVAQYTDHCDSSSHQRVSSLRLVDGSVASRDPFDDVVRKVQHAFVDHVVRLEDVEDGAIVMQESFGDRH